jgi:hypothetical protein
MFFNWLFAGIRDAVRNGILNGVQDAVGALMDGADKVDGGDVLGTLRLTLQREHEHGKPSEAKASAAPVPVAARKNGKPV